MVSLFYNLHSL